MSIEVSREISVIRRCDIAVDHRVVLVIEGVECANPEAEVMPFAVRTLEEWNAKVAICFEVQRGITGEALLHGSNGM